MPTASMPQVTDSPFSQEFEALFDDHYALVYRTAYGITGRVEDAEDIVQTIFLRLLQRGASRRRGTAGFTRRSRNSVGSRPTSSSFATCTTGATRRSHSCSAHRAA